MNQRRIPNLSQLIPRRTPRRRSGDGADSRRRTAPEDEAACHLRCNATVPPGPALGLCHAQCALDAAQAKSLSTAARSREEACHLHCNATVPPGPALAACHIKCALGGG